MLKLAKSKYMYSYGFTILLNSTSLSMISDIFKLLCIIMCSNIRPQRVCEAEEKINKLLDERPKNDDEYKTLIEEIEK